MPSPVQAALPRDDSELRLQRLLEQGLNSGLPVEFSDSQALARSLRQGMRERASTRGR